jgi:hypothetical protein
MSSRPSDRGFGRRSALRGFLGLAVLNGLTVLVFSLLLPLGQGALDGPTTLFILLLITLLVTPDDQDRPHDEV